MMVKCMGPLLRDKDKKEEDNIMENNTQMNPNPAPQAAKSNGLCIAGFCVSLITLFIFGFYGISGIVGIVLSAIGRSKAVQNGQKTGLGTAGIVLGIINTALTWLFLIIGVSLL